jgi:NNP family nitrate/nitrite transporter-like MFS transporter
LWTVQTLGGIFCVILGKTDSLAGSIVIMLIFSFFVQAACGLSFGIVPFISRRSLGLISGMTGGGGNVGAVITQVIFFHGSTYSTEEGITYMGIMIIACTLPLILVNFPQWGGMIFGPTAGRTAEDYYESEWSHHEQQKGYGQASLRFAENSVREGGRSAPGSTHKHTVPVEASPTNV